MAHFVVEKKELRCSKQFVMNNLRRFLRSSLSLAATFPAEKRQIQLTNSISLVFLLQCVEREMVVLTPSILSKRKFGEMSARRRRRRV